MKKIKVFSIFSALILSINAHSGVITDWEGTGVDFYSSWLDATTLRIEIDAANPTAGWSNAVSIDSIALNSPDAWSWDNAADITLSGPGTFSGNISGTGLNANGCQGLTLGANHQCWSGLAALTDNMFFDFTFSDVNDIVYQTDSPHLKVRFIDANGRKVGSLLSADLPGRSIPEPATLALLGFGLAGIVIARRKILDRPL